MSSAICRMIPSFILPNANNKKAWGFEKPPQAKKHFLFDASISRVAH